MASKRYLYNGNRLTEEEFVKELRLTGGMEGLSDEFIIGEAFQLEEVSYIEDDFEDLKEIHEKIRNILIDYGSEEFGDNIIDEISIAAGIQPTTVYYKED